MKIFAALLPLAFATPALAQHATRPDFPNHGRGGVTFEHFTKEQWDASNFASSEDMKTWQDRPIHHTSSP